MDLDTSLPKYVGTTDGTTREEHGYQITGSIEACQRRKMDFCEELRVFHRDICEFYAVEARVPAEERCEEAVYGLVAA